MSLDFKTLTFPEPLGPPRPVAGDLYFTYNHNWSNISTLYIYNKTGIKQNTSESRSG